MTISRLPVSTMQPSRPSSGETAGEAGQAQGPRPRGPLLFILIGALVYTAALTTLSICAHRAFHSQADDLGRGVHGVWSASQGDLLMRRWHVHMDEAVETLGPGHGEADSRLRIHANLIFWLLALIYSVFGFPEVLLFVTSAACAATGVGLFYIARRFLGYSWLAVVPSAAFWLNPAVHDANLYDFHAITVYTALLVWMIWAFEASPTRRRVRALAYLLLALALLCKEDVALVTGIYGAVLFLSKRRRDGLVVVVISASYFLLVNLWLIPWAGGGAPAVMVSGEHGRYSWLGTDLMDMLLGLFQHPGVVAAHLLNPEIARLPLYLLLMGGLAGLRAWPRLLLCLPHIAMAMLANSTWMTSLAGTYYWITCVAMIVIACSESAGRGNRNGAPSHWPLQYLLVASVLLTLVLSPVPLSIWTPLSDYQPAEAADHRALREVASQVPARAHLVAQRNLVPHVAHRLALSSFPKHLSTADYVLLRLRYVGSANPCFVQKTKIWHLFGQRVPKFFATVEFLLDSPSWRLETQRRGIYLFKRVRQGAPASGAQRQQYAQDKEQFMAAWYAHQQAIRPTLPTRLCQETPLFDFKGKRLQSRRKQGSLAPAAPAQ